MLVQPSLASPGSPLFTASHTLSPRHGDPHMIMIPTGMYPHEYMCMPDGTIPQLVSPSGNFSQGLCYTFRDTGTCKYGNSCKFAHLPQPQPFFAQPIPYVTSPLLQPQEDGYHQTVPQSAGICYQWRDTGTCSYGDTCKFDHHHEGQDGRVEGLNSESMTPTSPARSVASTPRFHDMAPSPSSDSSPLSSFSSAAATPPLPSKKPICYQWRDSGVCKFGDHCKFGHYTPKHKNPNHLQQDIVDAMSNMSFQSHLIPIVNPHYHDEEEEQPESGTMSPIQPLTAPTMSPIMIPPSFPSPTYYQPISPMQAQPFYYQPTPPPQQPQPMYQPTLCVPFLQTGSCRFGDRCRYQHTPPLPMIMDQSELAAQQAYALSLQQQQLYQMKLKKIQG